MSAIIVRSGSGPEFPAIVYQPGGITNGKGTYATWPEVMAAFSSTSGQVNINIDDSIVSPAPVSAGTHNLDGRAVIQTERYGIPTMISLPEGAVLKNPAGFDNAVLVNLHTATPGLVLDLPGPNALTFYNGGGLDTSGQLYQLMDIAAGEFYILQTFGFVALGNDGFPIADIAAGGTLLLNMALNSQMGTDVITGPIGANLLIQADASFLPKGQAGFAGTTLLNFYDQSNALRTTGAKVVVGTAAPPVAGDVLTATSAIAATWQAPGGGGGGWITAWDVDFTAQPAQALSPNGVYVIGGETFTKRNSGSEAAPAAIVGAGTGLQIFPSTGATTWDPFSNAITTPALTHPLPAGVGYTTPLRLTVWAQANPAVANFELEVFGIFNDNPPPAIQGIHVFRGFAGGLVTQVQQVQGGGTFVSPAFSGFNFVPDVNRLTFPNGILGGQYSLEGGTYAAGFPADSAYDDAGISFPTGVFNARIYPAPISNWFIVLTAIKGISVNPYGPTYGRVKLEYKL